jgi:hypothetical protein
MEQYQYLYQQQKQTINKISKKSIDNLHLIIVLDESGSMSEIRNDIVGSINTLIKEQQKLKKDSTTVTLIKFNDIITVEYEKRLLHITPRITENNYKPSGHTALYDAIGSAINKYDLDENVCMFIVTDGEENYSRKYNHQSITSIIDRKKRDDWQFIYLSADLQTAKQGHGLGFSANSTNVSYAQTQNIAVGYNQLADNIQFACNRAIGELRAKGKMQGLGSGSYSKSTYN